MHSTTDKQLQTARKRNGRSGACATHTEWSVYTLHDPRTRKIRYVGITGQPLRARYAGHLAQGAPDCADPKMLWVADLRSRGLLPIMRRVALFDGSRKEAEGAERAWMDLVEAKFGADLFNIHRGKGRRS